MTYKVVIVEGVIGVGKSTLSSELGDALGAGTLVLMEPDERKRANPYLALFYSDRPRWALTMQLHLLALRYRMHQHAQWHAMGGRGHAIVDRSLPGDTAFARLQLKLGDMSQDEFDTYAAVYHAMTSTVLLANVCVRLLVAPEVALERIQKRMERQTGRRCEAGVSLDYLKALDREIDHMAAVLRAQGVMVLDMPWDVERDTAEQRGQAVRGLAARIESLEPVDWFLDLHRRTI